MNKTLCELFAGVGGFRVGFELADKSWRTVWANQWEPSKKKQDAFECYCTHFGKQDNYINKDISQIDKKTMPDFTLLVGGFPCQDYSVAHFGAQGIKGKKGVLWWQIYDILRTKRPPFVLLENVDRLLKMPTYQRGRDFGVMLAALWAAGYNAEWRVINAADYGCVQRRRRLFIFAYRADTVYSDSKQKYNALQIINNQGFFANAFPVDTSQTAAAHNASFSSADFKAISDNFSFDFNNAGYMTNGKIVSAKATPYYNGPVTVLRDIMDHNVDDRYYLNDEQIAKMRYLKSAKQIERAAKDGRNYIFKEGAIPFPDSVNKPARTMLTSEGSINRSTHIVSDLDNGKLRFLTPNETNKIQGFPEHWTDTGMTERAQYFCMGNALVIDCVARMAKVLGDIVEKEG